MAMKLKCFWEHNGDDTLLYSIDFLGAYTRGKSLEIAKDKMSAEIRSFTMWTEHACDEKDFDLEISEEKISDLNICDADTDAIFKCETMPMSLDEYLYLKSLVLKSAKDFLTLYNSIPNKEISCLHERKTFYGAIPRTATEMYEHTQNVNSYYFGEIGIECDNDGDILSCRTRGFEILEQQTNFLENKPTIGSYGEVWSLKKMLRRFIWHDRIHAKAMNRMALKTFGDNSVSNIFHFNNL